MQGWPAAAGDSRRRWTTQGTEVILGETRRVRKHRSCDQDGVHMSMSAGLVAYVAYASFSDQRTVQ